jgi:MFS family permease
VTTTTLTPSRSRRGLTGLLIVLGVSQTGTRLSAIAVPWFVLAKTGSPVTTGLVGCCEIAPYVLLKFLSGPLLDRAGPRRVSICTDWLSAAAAAAIPVLHLRGWLPLWLLLVLVVIIGAARGPGDAAKDVMVPDAARDARVPMERATGLTGSVDRLSATLGPAAAGAAIALLGPLSAVALDAGSFAAGALVIAWALPRRLAPGQGQSGGSYLQRMREGASYLRGSRLLRAIVAMTATTNFLDAGMFGVLMPVWARDSGHGPAAIGAAMAALGITATLASLGAAAVAHRLPRRPVYLIGYAVGGAPRFLVLVTGAPLWAVLAVFAVSGLGLGFINPILGAVIYEQIPRPLLGRVISLADSASWAGIPAGGPAAGLLTAAGGLAPVLIGFGLAYLLVTTLAGLRPEWAGLDSVRGERNGAEADMAAAHRGDSRAAAIGPDVFDRAGGTGGPARAQRPEPAGQGQPAGE